MKLVWITNNAQCRLTVFAFAYELAELLPATVRANRRTTTTFRPFFAELSCRRGCVTPPPSGLTPDTWKLPRCRRASESIFSTSTPYLARSLLLCVRSLDLFFFFFFLNYASFNLKGSKTRRRLPSSTPPRIERAKKRNRLSISSRELPRNSIRGSAKSNELEEMEGRVDLLPGRASTYAPTWKCQRRNVLRNVY